jgi:hypothetical protein
MPAAQPLNTLFNIYSMTADYVVLNWLLNNRDKCFEHFPSTALTNKFLGEKWD